MRHWIGAIGSSVWLRNITLVVLWLGVWQIARLVEFTEHASVWFPASGLTFAALLFGGIVVVPAIIFSSIIITFWAGHYYNLALDTTELLIGGFYFSLAHISPYYLGARLFKWSVNSKRLNVPQLIFIFILIAALSSLLTTFLAISSLVYSNMMQVEMIQSTWLPFWIGDLAGVIVMGPLFVGIFALFFPKSGIDFRKLPDIIYTPAGKNFKYKVLSNLLLLTLCMLLAKIANVPEAQFAIFFLSVTHMWIACTEGPFFNVLSVAISSFFIALLVHVFDLMEYAMVYQFAIIIASANALFGMAVPALTADNHKLKEMISTDALTQVASHGYIKQWAKIEILNSLKLQLPMAMVVIDIDHFKQINDTYGHKIGDDTLKKVSQSALSLLRPTDLIGRYGGDEFVVLLPNTTSEVGVLISKRILEAVNQLEVDGNSITCSFGVAEVQYNDDFETLFERADSALYQAKKAGRNCVKSATDTGTYFPVDSNLNLNR